MAIIVDAKTPTQDASENSDTHHIDVPPPEYVAEELPLRTNNDLPVPVTTPADKPTTTLTNHDRWWRRWMRSPIALALIFLACAVIATGIGLAVHFTVGRPRPPDYPPWPDGGPGPNGNMTGADAYGPWTSSVKTFAFPRDTAHMEFVSLASFLFREALSGWLLTPPIHLFRYTLRQLSLQGLVDGYTQINVGRPDQTDIEADINIQWKARVLTSTPTVNSYYDPTNSSISITVSAKFFGSWHPSHPRFRNDVDGSTVCRSRLTSAPQDTLVPSRCSAASTPPIPAPLTPFALPYFRRCLSSVRRRIPQTLQHYQISSSTPTSPSDYRQTTHMAP